MGATEIHGITDRDVLDAPRFEDLARELLHALSGCVVAAHNVYFDLRFLRFELDRLGLFDTVVTKPGCPSETLGCHGFRFGNPCLPAPNTGSQSGTRGTLRR